MYSFTFTGIAGSVREAIQPYGPMHVTQFHILKGDTLLAN